MSENEFSNVKIRFACGCGQKILCGLNNSAAGKVVVCPKCKRELVAPDLVAFNKGLKRFEEWKVPDGSSTESSEGKGNSFSDDSVLKLPNPIARRLPKPEETARKLRDYRVIDVIAEGGMGTIAEACDDAMERVVVVKEIRPEYQHDDVYRARFVLEAKITGYLNHPGVVPVYALDVDENGSPFYAMRKVEGTTLDRVIKEYVANPSPIRLKELMRSFVSACHTIAYAHSVGVVHRDIKPANIMIGQFGETFVMDWGLAKKYRRIGDEVAGTGEGPGTSGEELDVFEQDSPADDLQLTRANERLGTRWYRDPDYLKTGKSRPCNDVYALGMILYLTLAGKLPYKKTKMSEKTTVLTTDAPFPSDVNRNAPKPLSAVCMKAIEKDPNDRYPSAEQLADDVQRWLDSEPVSVYRYSLLDRIFHRYN